MLKLMSKHLKAYVKTCLISLISSAFTHPIHNSSGSHHTATLLKKSTTENPVLVMEWNQL